MSSDDVTAWLTNEILEEMEAGHAGLYEFIWTLRGRFPNITVQRARDISKLALNRLRNSHNVKLVEMVWPKDEPVRDADWSSLSDRSWDDIPESGRYLAIMLDE